MAAREFGKRLSQALAVLRNRAAPAAAAPGKPTLARMYAAARESRLTSDWAPSSGSADAELASSLSSLRRRSRQLLRDAGYAKRAQSVVVNNVIGTGIGMQAQVMTSRDALADRVNDSIEEEWREWSRAENCHTGGRLSFALLERALMAQVFAAGEVLVRKHPRPFGSSRIPFALEVIEAERLVDEYASPYLAPQSGHQVRMGVEVDAFYRPVAYWIRRRHPNDYRFSDETPDMVERVPADQIHHLAVVDRWPQTRGEPWMHAVARTVNDLSGYTEAEITRSRVHASTPWTIETPEGADSFSDSPEPDADGSYEMTVEPGVAKRLNPGEKMNVPAINSPNSALEPFVRYMLRELAAGIGLSYESLSRDYSQSNYSSSRLALLDDRDLWRFYQSWFICEFREKVHREWMQAAVLARAIPGIPVEQYAVDPRKFEAVLFKPRGWSWIDPAKEVEAFKEAVKQGFTTVTDVIAKTGDGMDLEDVLAVRKRELEMMKAAGLTFETSPEFYMSDAAKALAEAKSIAKAAAKPPDEEDAGPGANTDNPPARRVFSFPRK